MLHPSPSKTIDPPLQGVPPKFTGLMERLQNVRERLRSDFGDPTCEEGHQRFMKHLEIYDSPGLLYAANRRPSSVPGNKARGPRVPLTIRPSFQTIGKRIRDNMSDHEKHLAKIDKHLLSHRDADRDLRRRELELSSEQREIQTSLHQLDSQRAVKERERLQAQHENNRDLDQFRLSGTKQRSERNKESITKQKERLQRLNENRKRVTKLETEAEHRYKKLSDALEMKTTEIKQLSGDFEEKMRKKEEEQIRLKKELADIAIGLSRQHHEYRARDESEQKQSKSEALKGIASSLVAEEGLSAQVRQKGARDAKIVGSLSAADVTISSKKEKLRGQERRTGHGMVGVHLRLRKNLDQIQLLESAKREAESNILETSIEQRMAAATEKKQVRVNASLDELREKNIRASQDWEKRACDVTRADEQRKRKDAVGELRRCVRAGESLEQRAFVLARDREGDRVHQLQLVGQIQQDLSALRNSNSKKLKEISLQTKKEEDILSQKLSREQAKLRKSWHARDEQLSKLQQERSRNVEERYLLGEYQREQQRTERIVAASSQPQQQV